MGLGHSRFEIRSSLASGKNKCTSLVCSCYAPVPKNNSDSKGVSSNGSNGYFNGRKGVGHEPCLQPPPPPLKSNIKKPRTVVVAKEQQKVRKVTWPDAHGMDLAHVLEFQSSVMEDVELRGVRNSCVCAIQ
ncbi:hypothetical protein J5N97_023100 [Dioscorea zingiberensis]|uniref:Uncharacterized protein n=1 Tax=Dioscorea zingiberensis TaxID=325984 RepID=A0A9D5CCD4_9LILI|nr:hypothetical protein J5N97_023100 [Dioscorea zingiberensis]